MGKRSKKPPKPGTWTWAKHTVREVAAEFNSYADFLRLGCPKGGGRSVLVVGVNCPVVGLECTPIPDPFIDRLADAFGGDDGIRHKVEKGIEDDGYSHRRAVWDWWKRNNPAKQGEFIHRLPLEWAEDITVVWCVRVVIPEQFTLASAAERALKKQLKSWPFTEIP